MRPVWFLLCILAVPSRSEADIKTIVRKYASIRRHPDLFDSKAGWKRWLSVSLVDALIDLRETGNVTSLLAHLREETPGVYSFEMFNAEFCEMFLEELDNYYESGLPIYRPNSMNNYGETATLCKLLYSSSTDNYGKLHGSHDKDVGG